MSAGVTSWQTYRTRFLVRAAQLEEPMDFVDALGSEHHGQVGDYLVESSDGTSRIAPRKIFEDIYVPMAVGPAPGIDANTLALARRDLTLSTLKRSILPRFSVSA
jgi:hypothetical protein